MARQAWSPSDQDRRMVQAMAGYGTPADDIARVLGISSKTLRKYCRAELDTAAIRANDQVKQTLFRIATGQCGNAARDRDGKLLTDKDGKIVYDTDWRATTSAAQYWLARRCGWREAPADPVKAELTATVDGQGATKFTACVILPDNGRMGPAFPGDD